MNGRSVLHRDAKVRTVLFRASLLDHSIGLYHSEGSVSVPRFTEADARRTKDQKSSNCNLHPLDPQ